MPRKIIQVEGFKKLSKWLAIFTFLLGIATFAGWFFNINILKNITGVPINPLTSVCLVFLAAALLFVDSKTRSLSYLGKFLAFLVFILASIKFLNIGGFNFPIDQLFFREQIIQYSPTNQMSFYTAICLVFSSLGIVLIDEHGQSIKNPGHFVTIPSLLIALMAAMGYVLGIGNLSSEGSIYPIALYTVIGFLTLDSAILLARPDRGLMTTVSGNGVGSLMIRIIFPFLVITNLVLGGARWLGVHYGLFGNEFGIALVMTVNMLLAPLIIWLNGNLLNKIEQERLTAGKKLHKEENLVKTVISSTAEGLLVVNNNLKVIYCNAAGEGLLGLKQKMIANKSLDQLISFYKDGDKMRKSENPIFQTLKFHKTHLIGLQDNAYLKNHLGKYFPFTAVISPLKTPDGINGVVITLRDISKEKEIDDAKTEFVSLASHQLRTPLSTINWYTEMLADGDAGKINSSQKSYIKEIYQATQRMIGLVNSLLDVSRMELGVFKIVSQPVNLEEICKIVINELKGSIEGKHLKVVAKCDLKDHSFLFDPSQAKVIFQNLLANAVQYTNNKGKITITVSKAKKDVLIKVSDNGFGIPKKDWSKIFTKLFRSDNVRQMHTRGSGLGLYLVKLIVNKWKGKIWFESVQNKGTTFFVSLPLKTIKI